ncbi:MAG: agmatine deiminase [Firmicutes bacterium HGW-Firmicutes-1]|jgi:agmatine deiminase|nr:MAG: agmatine deiminase [Firmicutes bacterium HGW-Firmicutes-1]
MINDSTPRKDGFRMPAEFEEQKQVFLLWPERKDVWHHEAKSAQKVFTEVAHAIARFEEVTVGVSEEQYEDAMRKLGPNVRTVIMPHDDVWTRDVGPTFVINDKGDTRGIDWDFNAWGGIDEGAYYPWDKDGSVAASIITLENVESYRTENFVLEGGSIHVDGEGTLLTTKECLLNKNRNPHLTQEEIEEYLRAYLNVEKIIWLNQGLFNDETDGHIDNICCFARPGEVILSWTDDESSPNYEICRSAYEILNNSIDAKGRTIKVYKLELPQPIFVTNEEDDGILQSADATRFSTDEPLPASYVNFLFCNHSIIMPIFNDPKDELAIKTLKEIFPDREIVTIYSREIILGGGNIHCISQQQPK